MNSIAKIYALTSVTLRGDIMLIPAWHFKTKEYPFDLDLLLPNFLVASKASLIPFLKFMNLVNFHHKGKLIISSYISIETNSLLDELNRVYMRFWKENSHISVIPERRHIVEQNIIKWSANLPKIPLGQFIHQYYSISVEETDWQSKKAIWKSLRQKRSPKQKLSAKKLKKLKEKYLKVWFKYFDKIEFSPLIQSKFPEFIETMNQLTFKDILPEVRLKLCPVCETDLGIYSSDIQYCPRCGYALFESIEKFCANCGAELRTGTLFCSNCGQKIEK